MPLNGKKAILFGSIALLAVCCDAADDGDDFSNNLFSDLSPLLALFGERVTMQFMSESMGWADNIILAMAPLGIITIVISAIRVGGPSWLKAVIGRARENLAAAEVELMSSTSDEVCELWNGREIVRCMGSAPVVELICLLPPGTRDPPGKPLGWWSTLKQSFRKDRPSKDSPQSPACGSTSPELSSMEVDVVSLRSALEEVGYLKEVGMVILAQDTAVLADSLLGVPDLDLKSTPPRHAEETQNSTDTTPPSHENGDKAESSHKISIIRNLSPGSPNIGLNTHGQSDSVELLLATVIGISLQLGILIYAGFVTYHPALMIPKDDKPIASYAFPCTTAGTLALVSGIALCAHVVESSTVEQRFETRDGRKIRIVWLQKEKTVSDQVFKSCIIYTKEDHEAFITSRRHRRHEFDPTLYELLRVTSYAIEQLFGKLWNIIFQKGRTTTSDPWARRPTSQGEIPAPSAEVEKDRHSLLIMKTISGAFATTVGFCLQFIGLRGMHWSVSIAQLGAVLIMVLLKAWVRRNLAKRPESKALTSDFQMDWLVKTLSRVDHEHWGGQGCEQGVRHDWVIMSGGKTSLVASKTQHESGSADHNRSDRATSFDRENLKKPGQDLSVNGFELDVSLNGLNIGTPSPFSPNMVANQESLYFGVALNAQQILEIREKLGLLTKWPSIACKEAISLSRAIEVTMNALFGSDPSITSFEWAFEACYNGSSPQMVRLNLIREEGKWKAPAMLIDAALSLWSSSVGGDVDPKAPFPESVEDHFLAESGASKTLKPSLGHHLRILGSYEHDLVRDLGWWVPRDVLRVYTVFPDKEGPLKFKKHSICGTLSHLYYHRSEDEIRFRPEEIDFPGYMHDWPPSDYKISSQPRRLLAVDSIAPIKELHAQDLFSSFMFAVASKLSSPIAGGVDELQPDDDTNKHKWMCFKLRSNRLSLLIQEIHRTGLGSLSQIYTSVITPLSYHQKLPGVEVVIDWFQRRAESFIEISDWHSTKRAVWYLSSIPSTSQSARICGILMTYLWRLTLRAEFVEEQKFGSNGTDVEREVLTDYCLEELIADLRADLQEWNNWLGSRHEHIIRLFDQRRCAGPELGLLPSSMNTGSMEFVCADESLDICVRARGYPDAFNVTGSHYSALTCATHMSGPATLRIYNTPIVTYSPDPRDILDRTPTHYAALGNAEYLERLVVIYGASIEAQDLLDWTPLHYACWFCNLESTRILVMRGAKVHQQTKDGATPLHYAAMQGFTEGARLLVEAGSMSDIRDHQGNIPLLLAAHRGHLEVVKLLRECGNPHLRDRQGRTALHQAALGGQKEIVEFLTGNDDAVDAKDRNGDTALSLAAKCGQISCIQTLLEKNADIETENNWQEMPLYQAACGNQKDAIRCLLKRGARLNQERSSWVIPRGLETAVFLGRTSAAQELLQRNEDPNLTYIHLDNMTMLMWATHMDNLAMVKLLANRGASVDQEDDVGRTCLHCVHSARVAEELLRLGASMRLKTKEGWTPLTLAASDKNNDVLKALLDGGVEVEQVDSPGDTILSEAFRLVDGEDHLINRMLLAFLPGFVDPM